MASLERCFTFLITTFDRSRFYSTVFMTYIPCDIIKFYNDEVSEVYAKIVKKHKSQKLN